MRPTIVFAVLGVLASVALAAGLVGPAPAEVDKKDGGVSARAGDAVVSDGVIRAGDAVVGDGVVRAGNAVVDEDGARIEDGPSVEGADQDSVGDEGNEEGQESAPVGEGGVVLKLKGDEGVEFSGTCSVGGGEKEIGGQVPDEFTFVLEGDELACEIRKEGNDGTLKLVLLSGDDRIVQRVSGDSTLKFTYSDNGVSSSTSSVSSSSSVVSQSSSVVQSSSSSTSR